MGFIYATEENKTQTKHHHIGKIDIDDAMMCVQFMEVKIILNANTTFYASATNS